MRRKSQQPAAIAEPLIEILAPVLASEPAATDNCEPQLSRTQKWADRWANRLRHDASQTVLYPRPSSLKHQ